MGHGVEQAVHSPDIMHCASCVMRQSLACLLRPSAHMLRPHTDLMHHSFFVVARVVRTSGSLQQDHSVIPSMNTGGQLFWEFRSCSELMVKCGSCLSLQTRDVAGSVGHSTPVGQCWALPWLSGSAPISIMRHALAVEQQRRHEALRLGGACNHL